MSVVQAVNAFGYYGYYVLSVRKKKGRNKMGKVIWTLVCAGLAIWMIVEGYSSTTTIQEAREKCIQYENGHSYLAGYCSEYYHMQDTHRESLTTISPEVLWQAPLIMFVVWLVPMLVFIVWRAVGGSKKRSEPRIFHENISR
ncbi:MAG: hypothetical protein AABZ46_07045 [Nitrospirota bacterium]